MESANAATKPSVLVNLYQSSETTEDKAQHNTKKKEAGGVERA
jgi:hypothetical protein